MKTPLAKIFVREESRMGLTFISASFILIFVFTFLPILVAIYFSFRNTTFFNIPGFFVGLRNYLVLWGDRYWWASLGRALLLTLINVPVTITIALSTAMILNGDIRGKTLFRFAYLVPLAGSAVAISIMWVLIYEPSKGGLLNYILLNLGIIKENIAWLGDPNTAYPALVFTTFWNFGFRMLIFLSALQGISPEYYEAARIDGANSWECFKHVTWPLLMPATFFIVVNALIHAFQSGFDIVYVLTYGGPMHRTEVASFRIYQTTFSYNQLGLGASMSVVMLVLTLILAAIIWKFLGKNVEYYM